MMQQPKTIFSLICILNCFFLCFSCGQKEDLGELYVQTLTSTELSDGAKLSNYVKITKSDNLFIAENAALQSLFITSDGKVLRRAQNMIDRFSTSEKIRVRYAELLFESAKYKEILSLSKEFPPSIYADGSKLFFLLIQSAAAVGDEAFLDHVSSWFSFYAIDENHVEFIKSSLFSVLPPFIQSLCTMRLHVYEKNYSKALQSAQEYIAYSLENNNTVMYERHVLSDIGKAYLYGTNDFNEGASLFEHIGKTTGVQAGDHVPFMAYFYAGRLYERALQYEIALSMYERSFMGAKNEDYDNALWYYLNLLEKISLQKTISSIQQTISSWNDPVYFADLIEKISVRLLSEKKWNEYFTFYTILQEYADPQSLAKCAYISARLIELDLIPYSFLESILSISADSKELLVRNLYEESFYGNHTSMYYRLLSAEKLNIPVEDNQDSFFYRKKADNFIPNDDITAVLRLYAEHGLFDLCYTLFMEHAQTISLDTAAYIASLMASSGITNPGLYPLSIRLILRAVESVDTPLTLDVLQHVYPRFYADTIREYCGKYELPEYLMYALVRSESLFDKNVTSHAGAVGLSQLMRPTAGDIARKLKINDYDLTDAHTNTEFGAFYLKELIGRLDGSIMLSLFSYNAGISKVRSWVRNDSGLPIDLFLETVPYSETRDYGRKVLAAAAYYGYLYYGMSTHEIVAGIMR